MYVFKKFPLGEFVFPVKVSVWHPVELGASRYARMEAVISVHLPTMVRTLASSLMTMIVNHQSTQLKSLSRLLI